MEEKEMRVLTRVWHSRFGVVESQCANLFKCMKFLHFF